MTTEQNIFQGNGDRDMTRGLMISPYMGDHPVTRDALSCLETPEPQGPRHNPYPFADYVSLVTDALSSVGLSVYDEAFALTHDNNRLFGVMQLRPSHIAPQDYANNPGAFALSLGLRGSHDQSITRGLVAGSNVFVCSNLCFSGEVEIRTKQTTHIGERLPGLILDAVQTLPGVYAVQDARYDAWQDRELKPRWGDAALVELVRRDVLPASRLPVAIAEWDEPSHLEHIEEQPNGRPAERTVWTLANAVTEALKPPVDPETERPTRLALPASMPRTVKLTSFLDEISGFDVGDPQTVRRAVEAVH